MTGQQLAEWRSRRPGHHPYKRNQKRPGWTQKQAAKWYGCSERSWIRWEKMDEIPDPVRLAVRRHERRFGDVYDAMAGGVSPASKER